MRYVFLGLSITSSWGNGHATTYRGLVRELVARGHDVLFLERDVPWYASHRDLPRPPWGRTVLYASVAELAREHEGAVRDADVVIVGSYVPDGIEVGRWVTRTARGLTAFYDIDTPVTLAGLEVGDVAYLDRDLIARYGLYLSFTGGPLLERLERQHGARAARPLYCSVDPALYHPEPCTPRYALGYLGTYSRDRQDTLDALLVAPARALAEAQFVVAGPQYPSDIAWPANVTRIEHLPPDRHRTFYAEGRFTLNVTRAAMIRAGFSPSVRLFEAAACGTPIISDAWEGLETVLTPGEEILVARSTGEALTYLRELSERERLQIGEAARQRVLAAHTAAHRAAELDAHVREQLGHSTAPA